MRSELLVHPDRQRARHEARERAERVAGVPRRQTQRRRDESGAQVELRDAGASRDVESRNDGPAEETDRERRERAEPKPRPFGRQKSETGPGRAGDRGEPDREIRRLPAGNREPEGEEERASRNRRAGDARLVFVCARAQG